MDTIRVHGILRITPGRLEEFKRFAAELRAVVHTKEAGANLYYEHFLDEGSEMCAVAEGFVSAEAFKAHGINAGPVAARAAGVFEPITITIMGDVGEELARSMKAEYGSVLHLFPSKQQSRGQS